MHMFDDAGALRRGKQKLVFYFDRRAENHLQSATPGELYDRYGPSVCSNPHLVIAIA